jgi:ADP-heptose:LPS heptosyltransferase
MLEGTRHSLGTHFARWRFRKSRDEVMSFTNAISSAQRVLLVMPLTTNDSLPTLKVIEMLKSKFREENITVVTGDRGIEVVRLLPRGQFMHLLKAQVSYFYLPRADFIHSIRQKRYDLAIDLNLDLVLPSGYICKVSGANVRVGFNQKHADIFYNFQVKPDPTLGRKLIYDRLVQCLQKF